MIKYFRPDSDILLGRFLFRDVDNYTIKVIKKQNFKEKGLPFFVNDMKKMLIPVHQLSCFVKQYKEMPKEVYLGNLEKSQCNLLIYKLGNWLILCSG